jgi:arylsulfatase A-like enzyme
MLCDDLGFGDVGCYNKESKIGTPFLDRMAEEGMKFTDAHTSSSVCTPARYAALTGRYCWRGRLKSGVLLGYDTDLIEPDRLTVPKLLKKAGYTTACIGKWHLGMGFPTTDGTPPNTNEGDTIDWRGDISGGPLGAGFDSYFGISASLDMPPYVYIRNNRFTEVPLRKREKDSRRYYRNRAGWIAPGFQDENVLPDLAGEAVRYIEEHSGSEQPFFLYFPVNSPHTPIIPSAEFQDSGSAGAYGDFVRQTDAVAGQIVETVERCGLAEDTLFIFSSDNGAETVVMHLEDDYSHQPSGHLKGMKRDLWDGGHRMPFLCQWKGTIASGSVCERPVCLSDLMATFAELAGLTLPDNAGEDSISFAKLLTQPDYDHARPPIIHHSSDGSLAIRSGRWKYIDCRGSGGNKYDREEWKQTDDYPGQLYDMEADVSERNNLYGTHPDKVAELKGTLEHLQAVGRSRSL